MGLENLKSIFKSGLGGQISEYSSKAPTNAEDTNFFNEPPQPTIYMASNPTDFSTAGLGLTNYTLLSNPPETFISQDLITKFYDEKTFSNNAYKGTVHIASNPTDFSTAGIGLTQYTPLSNPPDTFVSQDLTTKFYNHKTFGTNTYPGTIHIASNPTDFFPTAGIDSTLYTLGLGLETQSWENLYESNHSSKDSPSWGGRTPISYPNANRGKLNIRDQENSFLSSGLGLSRDAFLGIQPEPYIISNIPSTGGLSGGRIINAGNQSIPLIRATTDALRLTKYLSSPAGIAFIAKQNLLGVGAKIETPLLSSNGEQPSTLVSPQRYGAFYNPLSTIGAVSPLARLLGSGPMLLFRRDEGLPAPFGKYTDSYQSIHNTFGRNTIIDLTVPYSPIAAGEKIQNRGKKNGDVMTLAEMIPGDKIEQNTTSMNTIPDVASYANKLNTIGGKLGMGNILNTADSSLPFTEGAEDLESSKNGMPFYFKDMRDKAYIFFRAYIDGIAETVSPSWTTANYIGRSEPAYIYERGEREVNITFKLVAQTRDELDSIYQKMNRLTALCYPKYKIEPSNLYANSRMQPPLTKFRLGEMYGKQNDEVLGFIKALSYTVETSNVWEVERGARVPRNILVNMSYQIIHATVPQLMNGEDFTKFYGFTGEQL